MKVSVFLASMLLASVGFADNNPLTKKCVASNGGRDMMVEFNQDLTLARVSEKTNGTFVEKARLTCTQITENASAAPVVNPPSAAPAPGPTPDLGKRTGVQCHDESKRDAGYLATLFQSGDSGVYQAELSEQSIQGPKLLALMTCQ